MDASRIVTVLLLCASFGCGKKKPPPLGDAVPETTADNAASPAPEAPTAPLPEAAAEKPMPLELGDAARALLARWLETQNNGDFAAYESLYADRFTGIKRAGNRSRTFDRKGWMEDRARMFKKKMSVSAAALSVKSSSRTAVVEFTQTWESGTFKDTGPKQLVLAAEKDGSLRIAREEMLASQIVTPPAAANDLAPLFVRTLRDGNTYVFLDMVDASWGAGAPLPDPAVETASHSSARAVAPQHRQDAAELVKPGVTVYGRGNNGCHSALGTPIVLAGVTPHFGEVQEMNGEHGSKPWTERQIDAAIWGMSAHYLIAKLTNEACQGGSWALPGRTPDVKHWREVKDATLIAKARRRFHKTKDWRSVQFHYKEETKDSGPWDEGTIVTYQSPSGRTLAFATAAGGRGCGEWEGNLAVLIDLKSDKVLYTGAHGELLDLFTTADGTVGAIVDNGELHSLTESSDGFGEQTMLSFPDYDCPC